MIMKKNKIVIVAATIIVASLLVELMPLKIKAADLKTIFRTDTINEEAEVIPGPGMTLLDGVEFETNSEEIDISSHKIAVDEKEFAKQIQNFPNVQKLIMCDCGYTNEQMEYLRDEFPEIKVVWRLRFGRWSVRTDAISFSTLQPKDYTVTMNNADAAQLKYCTDLVLLDIGHNRITDVSFLQYMPELKIFIVHANYDRKNGGKIRDLSYLKYCPKLQYLEIFKSDVTDLSFLQYLPELKDLYASTTPISDITYLMDLPKLERLFIQDTRISKDDYLRLKERYPDAQILYYGNLSVWDNGWRNHPRYYAMRSMIKNNNVHELFADPVD